MAIVFKEIPDVELLYGQKSCPGCAALIAGRLALKVLGKKTLVGVPACCFAATTSVYPESALAVNNAVTAFPALASTISGMAVAAQVLGFGDDVHILGIGGDGGTVDIGLQALSGAMERNENIIYLCYDNEAYMNTGVQSSGATPYGASTTTTPAGVCSVGCSHKRKKPFFDIVTAHRVPYAATASTSFPKDFMEKMEKAKQYRGTRVIYVHAPCPTGWGYEPEKTIEVGRMAVEAGLWVLAEYENDVVSLTYEARELHPVEQYLKAQRRFKHLTTTDIEQITQERDEEWTRLKKRIDAQHI